jgi:hypothetical protein
MNSGAVLGCKSVTILCPEGKSTPINWVMFDVFMVITLVDL